MDNFFKAVTEEERAELVRKAFKEFEEIPAEFQHLVARTNEDYAAAVFAGTRVLPPPPIPQARPLTEAENNEHEASLIMSRLYGQRADDPISSLPECFRVIAEDQQAEALEKLLGPAHAARKKTQAFVDEVVELVLEKSTSPHQRQFSSERDRPGITTFAGLAERAKEAADETRDPAAVLMAKMLSAHMNNNKNELRRAVREMLAAEAAA